MRTVSAGCRQVQFHHFGRYENMILQLTGYAINEFG